MKLYAIRDAAGCGSTVGFLFYYESAKRFYIELDEKTDEWSAPFLLSEHAGRKEYSVDSEWSGAWVDRRIVPVDRQNLGMILKANGLKTYDPHRLLVLGEGRCAQDDLYIESISAEDLPADIRARLQQKLREIVPLPERRLLAVFRDGEIRLADPAALRSITAGDAFSRMSDEQFLKAVLEPGGNGVEWDMTRLSAESLRANGKKLPLTSDDLFVFLKGRIVSTSEAAEILHCSRQYIAQLQSGNRLVPVRMDSKNTWFLRGEVEELVRR